MFLLFGVHRFLDTLRRPLGLVLQNIGSEFGGTFNADASMAQGTRKAIEQVVRRRIVKVDIVAIRKDELHQPQRVRCTGSVAKLVVKPIGFSPIDSRWIDGLNLVS